MFWAETGVFHARTSIISVLVEADKHANNFQMFFGIFQESSKTGRGRKKGKKEKQKQRLRRSYTLTTINPDGDELDFYHF